MSPFIFTSVSSQIKDYYREEHGYISDEFYAELNCNLRPKVLAGKVKILFSDLWSLLVLAELAFVGNIIFLIPLTAAVKNVGNLFQEEENLNFIIFSEKCKVVLCLVLLDADIFHHFWIILWCSYSVSGKVNSYFFFTKLSM